MFVSKAENALLFSRLGVYFSEDSISVNHKGFLTYIPQISPEEILLQSDGWQKVIGIYHAMGGEQFISIGNFEANTPNPNAPFNYSYYFIDDISVRDTCLPVYKSGLLPKDTAFCLNRLPFQVEVHENQQKQWLWSDGSTDSVTKITYGGNWWVWVSNGTCSYYDSMVINTYPVPYPNLGLDRKICKEDTALLFINSSGNKIEWFNGDTLEYTAVKPPGIFWVKLENAYGCSQYDSIKIDSFQTSLFTLGNDTFICEGLGINITSSKPFKSYLWQDGSTKPSLFVQGEGMYSLTIKDENNCISSDTLKVFVRKLALPQINDQYKVCIPDFVLYPGSYHSYLWQDGSNDSIYHISDYGFYHLIVKDEWQCSIEKSFSVENYCPGTLFVPNIFTPNLDRLNDEFKPVYENIKEIEWMIFNRFGEIIFYTKDGQIGWDGNINGMAAPSGVFGYRINATSFNEVSISKSGTFTLMR